MTGGGWCWAVALIACEPDNPREQLDYCVDAELVLVRPNSGLSPGGGADCVSTGCDPDWWLASIHVMTNALGSFNRTGCGDHRVEPRSWAGWVTIADPRLGRWDTWSARHEYGHLACRCWTAASAATKATSASLGVKIGTLNCICYVRLDAGRVKSPSNIYPTAAAIICYQNGRQTVRSVGLTYIHTYKCCRLNAVMSTSMLYVILSKWTLKNFNVFNNSAPIPTSLRIDRRVCDVAVQVLRLIGNTGQAAAPLTLKKFSSNLRCMVYRVHVGKFDTISTFYVISLRN